MDHAIVLASKSINREVFYFKHGRKLIPLKMAVIYAPVVLRAVRTFSAAA